MEKRQDGEMTRRPSYNSAQCYIERACSDLVCAALSTRCYGYNIQERSGGGTKKRHVLNLLPRDLDGDHGGVTSRCSCLLLPLEA